MAALMMPWAMAHSPMRNMRRSRSKYATSIQCLRSENFSHRLPLGQLVHQLVQVSDFPHQRVLDLFDPDAADLPGDPDPVRIQGRSLAEKVAVAERRLLQPGQVLRGIACEPGG